MWSVSSILGDFMTSFLILTSCCWFELGFIEPDAFSDDAVPDSVTRTGTLFIYLFIYFMNWTRTGPWVSFFFCFCFGGTRIGTWTILNFLKEPETDVLHQSQEAPNIDDATLQNYIYKHTKDFENVQRNKKKGECTGHKVSSN